MVNKRFAQSKFHRSEPTVVPHACDLKTRKGFTFEKVKFRRAALLVLDKARERARRVGIFAGAHAPGKIGVAARFDR